jgi:predicted lipoprotein with Yx(FWY)xxD motif
MDPQARGRAAKIAGVAGITLLVAACGSSSPSNSAKSKVSAAAHSSSSSAKHSHSKTSPRKGGSKTTNGAVTLKAEHTALGTALATSQGYTLYGFSKDSPAASACTGSCATTWHPLTGTPKMAPGSSMPGTLGTITRAGGVRQATFDGHPLYTYKDDTAPGQVKGNDVAEYGGRWLAIPVTAAVTPVAPTNPSKSAMPTSPAKPGMPTKPATLAPSHARGGGAGP